MVVYVDPIGIDRSKPIVYIYIYIYKPDVIRSMIYDLTTVPRLMRIVIWRNLERLCRRYSTNTLLSDSEGTPYS